MNHFIPVLFYPLYNGLTRTAFYPIQEMPKEMYRQSTREERLHPNQLNVETHSYGSGFKLYRWHLKMIKDEYLICRMDGKSSETVISAGFTTFPIEPVADVYAVQNYPNGQHNWIITLKNNSGRDLVLDLFLIVKV